MRRLVVVSMLMSSLLFAAEEPAQFKLAAPNGWGGETIQLPPGFAPDMEWKGLEHIRFAPGMMKPASDTFFSYAFAFELEAKAALTKPAIQREFLKYYRGLCKAVLKGKRPDIDFSTFTLELEPAKSDGKPTAENSPTQFKGALVWVEPFATGKPQTLNLEIWTWAENDRKILFACVSPQATDAAIWKQLRAIRDDYRKK